MPHAKTLLDDQDRLDEELIRHTFSTEGANLLNDLESRDLDQSEKLPEAVDFADLSDDDLADDEGQFPATELATNPLAATTAASNEQSPLEQGYPQVDDPTETDTHNNELDDLFRERSPRFDAVEAKGQTSIDTAPLGTPNLRPLQSHVQDNPAFDNRQECTLSKEQQMQQDMFAQSAANFESSGIPRPPENDEELLASLWPRYQRGAVPKFLQLISQKPGTWPMKVPPKFPKPLSSTKLNLELAQDQERKFKVCIGDYTRIAESTGCIDIIPARDFLASQNNDDDENDNDEMHSDFEDEQIGGVSWHDLSLMCEDWCAAEVAALSLVPCKSLEQDVQASDDRFPRKVELYTSLGFMLLIRCRNAKQVTVQRTDGTNRPSTSHPCMTRGARQLGLLKRLCWI